jgi:methyl-accepting chemotaxis protein
LLNQAIMQMDDVTQQNAALVEQTAAAAEALQMHGLSLVQGMGVFRLPGATQPVAETRKIPLLAGSSRLRLPQPA